METTPFGRLDFHVSRISFGGGSISGEGGGYGFGDITESEAISLLKASYDKGINIFDTAPIYGLGLSEQRIGKAFSGMREKVFIVSKCGVVWDKNKKPHIDNSATTTRRMIDQSLKDLRTDYIDLYLVHWPDKKTDICETMEALAEAKRAGKLRAVGLSNFYDIEQIERAQAIERIDVLQTEYNIFHDEARETFFPYLKEKEIGYMTWGTFDKGVLTGRVTRNRTFDASDFRRRMWANTIDERKMRAMDRITPLLKENNSDGRKLAFGFVFRYPEVSTAICGVRSIEQLETAIAALNQRAPEELVDQAAAIAAQESAA